MEATARKTKIPLAIWIAVGLVAALLATYPFFFKPIKDTPATEGQSIQDAPASPSEPASQQAPPSEQYTPGTANPNQ